ncbi:MAG: hypothetical protein AAF821_04545 [Cyanobacteria bacterium P01_D01_bin.156]
MKVPFSIRYNNVKLKAERLYKTSNHPSSHLFSGLEDISFSLRGGECIHVVSPVPWANQLFLDTLTGHTPMEAGAIWLQHQDQWLNLSQLSQRQLNQVRNQTMGYLQSSETLRALPTVLDCVLVKFLDLGMSHSQAREHSRHVLDWVGLPRGLWHRAPANLPLSELNQVNLARTFAVDYNIIVIGLPLSQLDRANQVRLVELIEYRKEKGTCFIGRFDQPEVRTRVCDLSLSLNAPTPITAAGKSRRSQKGSAGSPIGEVVSSKAVRSY